MKIPTCLSVVFSVHSLPALQLLCRGALPVALAWAAPCEGANTFPIHAEATASASFASPAEAPVCLLSQLLAPGTLLELKKPWVVQGDPSPAHSDPLFASSSSRSSRSPTGHGHSFLTGEPFVVLSTEHLDDDEDGTIIVGLREAVGAGAGGFPLRIEEFAELFERRGVADLMMGKKQQAPSAILDAPPQTADKRPRAPHGSAPFLASTPQGAHTAPPSRAWCSTPPGARRQSARPPPTATAGEPFVVLSAEHLDDDEDGTNTVAGEPRGAPAAGWGTGAPRTKRPPRVHNSAQEEEAFGRWQMGALKESAVGGRGRASPALKIGELEGENGELRAQVASLERLL